MTAAAAVLARMARAVLGEDAALETGEFTLRPAQRRAVRATERALQEFGGAVIADAPGTGKTILALAIAARYESVLIVVPAAVREQWQRAAARAAVHARLETLEGLSHGRRPEPAALIIVDEAHHVRTPNTARYRALAELAMHRHLLLLTATPVVNSLRDRDALLALFLGERAGTVPERVRSAAILRLASDLHEVAAVTRLPDLATATEVHGLAEALEQLPAPLPLADGAQATAIVRLTLAMAWASSLAALDSALRRRLERGRTLDDQLAAGHWPSRDALRAWILGEDATQLAFGFDAPTSDSAPEGARELLALHIEAVQALRALIRPHVNHDAVQRAEAILALLNRHQPRRVLVLAQSAVTVRALYSVLRHQPGVVAITGQRVHAAAGRWTRDEVLRALGPAARPYDPRDLRGIRLLIATDILAEGVELQGASLLVHADPTWTPARMEQRVGRVAREGQREQVLVTAFAVHPAALRMLQLRERLTRKAAARRRALGVAELTAQLRQRLQVWAQGTPAADTAVAAIRATNCGFVVLIRENGATRLLAGEYSKRQWRIRDSPAALLRVLPSVEVEPRQISALHLKTVRRLLGSWHRSRRAAQAVAGDSALPDDLLRSLRRRLEVRIAHAPLASRNEMSRSIGELLLRIALLRGRGAEQQLSALLRCDHEAAELQSKLEALCAQATRPTPRAGTGRISIEALLLLVADQPQRADSGPALP